MDGQYCKIMRYHDCICVLFFLLADRLARPLRRTIIQQITSWVTFGEIVDPTEEFFIKERRTSRHILQSYKNLGADASYIGEGKCEVES